MKKLLLSAVIFLSFLISSAQQIQVNHWETVVFGSDVWHYRPGTSEPESNWRSLSYDDSGWSQGTGGFGYGDNDDSTVVSPNPSLYLRIKFPITDTSVIGPAVLSIDYDDAFIAYLNGTEIGRSGLSGDYPAFDALGTSHEAKMYSGGLPESFLVERNKLRLCLTEGQNVLAIQVHNSSVTSSDMSAIPFFSLGITDNSSDYRPVPDWFVPPSYFLESDLPIVIITTPAGQAIVSEPKITADLKIISNSSGLNRISDSGNVYTGKIGIEIRGHHSASLPQKPYGFETRDVSGANLNVPLLGMASENDWVLIANYNDKSFSRNVLAQEISRRMGHYAPGMRFVELVLNNEYRGIYILAERIKRDAGRVNIAELKPADISGDQLTGGYIFKTDSYTANDSWKSNYSPINSPGSAVYFVYHDPDWDELNLPQKNYIQAFVNSLERTLYGPGFKDPSNGYRAYIDIWSFADHFIIGEVSRNIDAYKKSRYFYKNRDSRDPLLHSGPEWDFDWAWKNVRGQCANFSSTDGSGWAYRVNDCNHKPVPPSWEVRMLQDATFSNLVYSRYAENRKNILSEPVLFGIIDSVSDLLSAAQARHFDKWKILGINVGTPEVDVPPDSFEGEIIKLKSWISTRLDWLDQNMTVFKGSSYSGTNYPVIHRVFPNPASGMVYFESNTEIRKITLYSISGSSVYEIVTQGYAIPVDISGLPRGIYFARMTFTNGKMVTSRIIRE